MFVWLYTYFLFLNWSLPSLCVPVCFCSSSMCSSVIEYITHHKLFMSDVSHKGNQQRTCHCALPMSRERCQSHPLPCLFLQEHLNAIEHSHFVNEYFFYMRNIWIVCSKLESHTTKAVLRLSCTIFKFPGTWKQAETDIRETVCERIGYFFSTKL